MNSWFTEAHLIKEIMNAGLDGIDMVKRGPLNDFINIKGRIIPLEH